MTRDKAAPGAAEVKAPLRKLIPALMLFIFGALAAKVGILMLHAGGDETSGPSGLLSAIGLPRSFCLLPARVTGLVQSVFGRTIGPNEIALIVAGAVIDAVVVGVIFRLVLGGRSFGFMLNALIALSGIWCVLLLYDFNPDAEPLADLNALVARAIVASVAAPAILIVLKAVVASEASTFLAGADTRAGDAIRGAVAKAEDLASGAVGLRPKGPSAERIRSALDRSRS